jgi:hypothetical protein
MFVLCRGVLCREYTVVILALGRQSLYAEKGVTGLRERNHQLLYFRFASISLLNNIALMRGCEQAFISNMRPTSTASHLQQVIQA